jgi:hypothetical protein
VGRIVRVYRHRWTGTEALHRDGKQRLGPGDRQLRDVRGQARHMHLVILASSLLMGQWMWDCAREWASTCLSCSTIQVRLTLRGTLAVVYTYLSP